MDEPSYIGHRQRIKQKFKENGLSGWHNYEILEFALFFVLPRQDTKPMAKELISKFKNLNGVLFAQEHELLAVQGISKHASLFLQMLRDLFLCVLKERLFLKDVVSSPGDVYDYLKLMLAQKKNEEFIALFLNSRNNVIAIEQMQKGTVDEAVVYPRNIAERALWHHSTSVIIAHNHPGGSLEPSKEDIKVTKTIKEALSIIDISLLDHILISSQGYFSWREKKLM